MDGIKIKSPVGKISAAVIAGSGLAGLMPEFETVETVPYTDIDGFPATQVKGHPGEIVFGTVDGIPLALFRGRFHLYEGHNALTVALPVRAASSLGARFLYLTNASGGISSFAEPGSLMLVTDHLNLSAHDPVRDIPVEKRTVDFPDLSSAYNPDMMTSLKKASLKTGIKLNEGVLASLPGPCYETPAEVRMLKTMGADAVSMSVVHEIIMASYLGVAAAAVTVITNRAAGLDGADSIEHIAALNVAASRAVDISSLITFSLKELCC